MVVLNSPQCFGFLAGLRWFRRMSHYEALWLRFAWICSSLQGFGDPKIYISITFLSRCLSAKRLGGCGGMEWPHSLLACFVQAWTSGPSIHLHSLYGSECCHLVFHVAAEDFWSDEELQEVVHKWLHMHAFFFSRVLWASVKHWRMCSQHNGVFAEKWQAVSKLCSKLAGKNVLVFHFSHICVYFNRRDIV
jgi:hypothetical protein